MTAASRNSIAANERELKDKAHLLVRQGKLEAATEIYLVLITQNAKDPSLRIHHAELCDKLERPDRAIASYQVAAHLFTVEGHTARARAALSCGLRISPRDAGLLRALRELSPEAAPTPPHLSLVPPPAPFDDDDEPLESGFLSMEASPPTLSLADFGDLDPFDPQEAVTDPYCPVPDWSVKDSLKRTTVSQRPRDDAGRARADVCSPARR